MQYLQAPQEAKVETERNMTGPCPAIHTRHIEYLETLNLPFLIFNFFFISAYFMNYAILYMPLICLDAG
jgi:hypothetical protein